MSIIPPSKQVSSCPRKTKRIRRYQTFSSSCCCCSFLLLFHVQLVIVVLLLLLPCFDRNNPIGVVDGFTPSSSSIRRRTTYARYTKYSHASKNRVPVVSTTSLSYNNNIINDSVYNNKHQNRHHGVNHNNAMYSNLFPIISRTNSIRLFGFSPYAKQEQYLSQQQHHYRRTTRVYHLSKLWNSNNNNNDGDGVVVQDADDETKDPYLKLKTTFSLIIGQSILILAAIGTAALVGTPNYSFGPGIAFTSQAIGLGCLATAPLGLLAFVLDKLEPRFVALQDVTKASQRSVLTLMGSTFNPKLAIIVSILLGTAAGFGEEMIFRGILQYEIGIRSLNNNILAIGISSIIFGILHSVTPLYAILATVASFYFGFLYVYTNNLAVPIICHAVYDIAALFYAHYTVAKLPTTEQEELYNWISPTEKIQTET